MRKRYLVLLIAYASCLTGCYYDNIEELYPGTGMSSQCDTGSTITYSGHVVPVLQNYCITCHNVSSPSGGYRLDTYSNVKSVAVSGLLMSAITWDGTATPMPQGSSVKIDSCYIARIDKWIKEGSPNN